MYLSELASCQRRWIGGNSGVTVQKQHSNTALYDLLVPSIFHIRSIQSLVNECSLFRNWRSVNICSEPYEDGGLRGPIGVFGCRRKSATMMASSLQTFSVQASLSGLVARAYKRGLSIGLWQIDVLPKANNIHIYTLLLERFQDAQFGSPRSIKSKLFVTQTKLDFAKGNGPDFNFLGILSLGNLSRYYRVDEKIFKVELVRDTKV
ncbi:hypothetical protein BT96DRAFT_1056883 [Gymnopus androsaceus JB14]|uniref:Uncharacterized protein n=1 Tax=Gymnopus androsaceus JB14 TaxID=1447944 RepID=A0A6A4GAH0_9AGAR|nr:hypothetical protein BT96DRAFT_1056883 [Gymnopus androsaceus JB14]